MRPSQTEIEYLREWLEQAKTKRMSLHKRRREICTTRLKRDADYQRMISKRIHFNSPAASSLHNQMLSSRFETQLSLALDGCVRES